MLDFPFDSNITWQEPHVEMMERFVYHRVDDT